MQSVAAITKDLKDFAHSLGFDRVGIAKADALHPEGKYLKNWIEQGHAASMLYMLRSLPVRIDPRHPNMLENAQSVIALAIAYGDDHQRIDVPLARVAKYVGRRDYHNAIAPRLRRIEAYLRSRGFRARGGVDSFPVFERAWAQRAGIGFVGKNCCLIVPGLGSYVFLATIVTDAELTADAPMSSRCGDCTRCLQGCPTSAFVAPHRLDARRCISYLTIENKGTVPKDLRSGVGNWLFGCDACQQVCPYNHSGKFKPVLELQHRHVPSTIGLQQIMEMSEQQFDTSFAGTPWKRAGRQGLMRNAMVVLGNVGTEAHVHCLQIVAQQHEQSSMREIATWAIEQTHQRASNTDNTGIA